jgi:hypothetical protein
MVCMPMLFRTAGRVVAFRRTPGAGAVHMVMLAVAAWRVVTCPGEGESPHGCDTNQ